ncbi:hypothetical protein [Brucella intermedia]|uniref:hypothetical protein n=1 Tax=Brucella intermedia TaxID=94625 RepID=UPI0021CA1F84|nr:hypothetical protein [Brucella intermedia]UXO85562.1 hypothetical protein N8I72_14435 [Brucella intermedia]
MEIRITTSYRNGKRFHDLDIPGEPTRKNLSDDELFTILSIMVRNALADDLRKFWEIVGEEVKEIYLDVDDEKNLQGFSYYDLTFGALKEFRTILDAIHEINSGPKFF